MENMKFDFQRKTEKEKKKKQEENNGCIGNTAFSKTWKLIV